ncbi:unnamed protein product [Arabis nemorensis]|uniref:Zinc knuckle CX2CX4HX4C domain-containing protein n=1 Tax=Arabis nemorensis TaxID=586526 RepID=A0A565AV73_9BRAS|nr:unnamed protein product [Arabis nemorensis]
MNMEIMLPNEEVTTVEFEYKKLEKHCFSCFSLSHEERDCHMTKEGVRDLSKLGINQRKVLNRMEAERRWDYERRQLGPNPNFSYKRTYRDSSLIVSNYRGSFDHREARREPVRNHMEKYTKEAPPRASREPHNRDADRRSQSDIRGALRRGNSYYRPVSQGQVHSSQSATHSRIQPREIGFSDSDLRHHPVLNGNQHGKSISNSKISHTPPPNPRRDPISPIIIPNTRQEEGFSPRPKGPARERLSFSRTSALQRLGETHSSDSGQLQDITVHYLEENETNLVDNRVSALRRSSDPPSFDLVQVTIPNSANPATRRANTKGSTLI